LRGVVGGAGVEGRGMREVVYTAVAREVVDVWDGFVLK